MAPPLWQKVKRNSKASWWKWKWRGKKLAFKAQHSENEDHGIRSHLFVVNRWGNSGNSVRLYFGGLQNHCSHKIKRHLLLGRKVITNLDSILKSRDIPLPTKVRLVKAMVFPVEMYGCESWVINKEGWAPKNWHFRTVVLEKILESPLYSKEIIPVDPKGNQTSIFIGRTGAEAEAPILWLPDGNMWLTGKDPDAGNNWEQEEKRATEDEMFGWHHWLNGHELEQTQGDSDGQRSLACCSSWGLKESNTT